jgi:hypothetical protein
VRRVRRAAWGNGPGAIRVPRPRPTQPSRRLRGRWLDADQYLGRPYPDALFAMPASGSACQANPATRRTGPSSRPARGGGSVSGGGTAGCRSAPAGAWSAVPARCRRWQLASIHLSPAQNPRPTTRRRCSDEHRAAPHDRRARDKATSAESLARILGLPGRRPPAHSRHGRSPARRRALAAVVGTGAGRVGCLRARGG